MSTENNIFYGVKITLDTTTTIAEAFLYNGEILFADNGYNSTSATYEDTTPVDLTNLVNDRVTINGVGKSVSTIDLTEGGNFSTLNQWSVSIVNRNASNDDSYHGTTTGTPLIGAKMQFYVIIDDIWYERWSGIVSNYVFSQEKFTFNGDDPFVASSILLPQDENKNIYLGNIKNAPIKVVKDDESGIYTVLSNDAGQLLEDIVVNRVFPNSTNELDPNNDPFTDPAQLPEDELFKRPIYDSKHYFNEQTNWIPYNRQSGTNLWTMNNEVTCIIAGIDLPSDQYGSIVGKYVKFKSSDELLEIKGVFRDYEGSTTTFIYVDGYPTDLDVEIGAGYAVDDTVWDNALLTDAQTNNTISIVEWNSKLDISLGNIQGTDYNDSKIILPYDVVGSLDGVPIGLDLRENSDGTVSIVNTSSIATLLPDSLHWSAGPEGSLINERSNFVVGDRALTTDLSFGEWIGTMKPTPDSNVLTPGSAAWKIYAKDNHDSNFSINLRTRYDNSILVFDEYTPSISLMCNVEYDKSDYDFNSDIDGISFDAYRTYKKPKGYGAFIEEQACKEIFSSGDNKWRMFTKTYTGEDSFIYTTQNGISTIQDFYRREFEGDQNPYFSNAYYWNQQVYPFNPFFDTGSQVAWSINLNTGTPQNRWSDYNIAGYDMKIAEATISKEDLLESNNSDPSNQGSIYNRGGLVYTLTSYDGINPEWAVYEMNHIGLMSVTRLEDKLDDLRLNITSDNPYSPTTMNVYEAFQFLVDNGTKDVVADYTNLEVTRSDWLVGKLIDTQKKTHEYLRELCKQSFVAGYTNRNGDLTFKSFLEFDPSTPINLSASNVIDGSLKNFAGTPLSKVYNEITVNYNFNHGTDEFEESYGVTNVDANEFPSQYANVVIEESPATYGHFIDNPSLIDFELFYLYDTSTSYGTPVVWSKLVDLGNIGSVEWSYAQDGNPSWAVRITVDGNVLTIVNPKAVDTNIIRYDYKVRVNITPTDISFEVDSRQNIPFQSREWVTDTQTLSGTFNLDHEIQINDESSNIINMTAPVELPAGTFTTLNMTATGEIWTDYVTGVNNYWTAKALWDASHNAYVLNRTINKSPEDRTNLDWYFDRNNFYNTNIYDQTEESAYQYFTEAVRWMPIQKFKTNLQLPLNHNTVKYEICDPIVFNDPIITGPTGNGAGWFTKISVNPKTDTIDAEVMFETFNFGVPSAIGDCVVITETGLATDPDITETGNASDPDITEPCDFIQQ